ncbi:leucine-rich repeat-containing protein 15-like [Panonychus citri]|uniref:leucine-rich repeat-containing protein 15-like n=1 Tax=Panonychus citri TaxID=50023 RepID=UPI0023071A40|nr:leucine-rich repeat-containing protein 15-like [Panonychus citri]
MSDSLSKFPSSLKYLQLNNNTIYTVHNDSLTGQSGLEILWLNWNKIQKLTKQVFASCSGLQKLYLENNEISSIEVGTFESLSQLIYLNLENNNLNHLSEGVFRGVTSLAKLYLSGNHLMDIEPASFSSLSLSLRYLSMSNNQLYVIRNHFFTNLSNLDELYLSNVMVEEIDPLTFSYLTSLTILDLSDNNLSSDKLDTLALPSTLKHLNISSNNGTSLKSYHFLSTSSLSIFDASFSGISSYFKIVSSSSSSSCSSLHTLFLQGNGLTSVFSEDTIPPSSISCPQLSELYLDYNLIEFLPKPELGMSFPSLRVLSLSSNRLRHIGSGSFRHYQHLEKLNLSNNSLSTLDPGSLVNLR